MTLSFSQQINGNPNYFVQKIWKSIKANIRLEPLDYEWYEAKAKRQFNFDITKPTQVNAKDHTIRVDPHKRWRAGMSIHPVISNRTPNRFQFAPTIKCVSVQRIDIKDVTDKSKTGADLNYVYVIKHRVGDVDFYLAYEVYVDGKRLMSDVIERLAINDGFESADSFFEYFKDGIVDGSLIHWTDIKY